MIFRRSIVLLLLSGTLILPYFACSFDVDYKGATFRCKNSEDCPDKYVCSGNRCFQEGTEIPASKCDGGNCTDGGPVDTGPVVKKCASKSDCSQQETCRPDIDGTGRVCVPRCDTVKQQGCGGDEVCVIASGQTYCRKKTNKKRTGQLCKQDLDCELHLYCRPVKNYQFIKRCAPTCELSSGCSLPKQACLELRKDDRPYGYCQPQPTLVKQGEICGGDLICPQGLSCKKETGAKYSKCL